MRLSAAQIAQVQGVIEDKARQASTDLANHQTVRDYDYGASRHCLVTAYQRLQSAQDAIESLQRRFDREDDR